MHFMQQELRLLQLWRLYSSIFRQSIGKCYWRSVLDHVRFSYPLGCLHSSLHTPFCLVSFMSILGRTEKKECLRTKQFSPLNNYSPLKWLAKYSSSIFHCDLKKNLVLVEQRSQFRCTWQSVVFPFTHDKCETMILFANFVHPDQNFRSNYSKELRIHWERKKNWQRKNQWLKTGYAGFWLSEDEEAHPMSKQKE